jgi:uncharacterized protein YeaO (DUF488 family)
MIRVARVYDAPTSDDGFRVLVDRLWPRGLRKDRAAIDLWLRDIAPSDALRRWFDHDPSRWSEFCRRYARELEGKDDVLRFLRSKRRDGNLTLLFGAHDREFNNAVALRNILVSRRTAPVARGHTAAKGTARGTDRGARRRRTAPPHGLGRGHHGAAAGGRPAMSGSSSDSTGRS